MDVYQHQYDFSVDEAVKKWRTLTANDGILLENEFNVCYNSNFSMKLKDFVFSIRLFENSIPLV
jgi:hypothetical protein